MRGECRRSAPAERRSPVADSTLRVAARPSRRLEEARGRRSRGCGRTPGHAASSRQQQLPQPGADVLVPCQRGWNRASSTSNGASSRRQRRAPAWSRRRRACDSAPRVAGRMQLPGWRSCEQCVTADVSATGRGDCVRHPELGGPRRRACTAQIAGSSPIAFASRPFADHWVTRSVTWARTTARSTS